MKKIIAVILSMVMLCGMMALAETESGDIGWGTMMDEVLLMKGEGETNSAFDMTAVVYDNCSIIGYKAMEMDGFIDNMLCMIAYGRLEDEDGTTPDTEQLNDTLTSLYGEPLELTDEEILRFYAAVGDVQTETGDVTVIAWKADEATTVWLVNINDQDMLFYIDSSFLMEQES